MALQGISQSGKSSRGPKRIAISGCSGGGKSSLIDALAKRGYSTFSEPGREIVREQLATAGDALPWLNSSAFIELCLARATSFYEQAEEEQGIVFYDRSIIDALSAAESMGEDLEQQRALVTSHRYYQDVFLVPPWAEIYVQDDERQHGFEAAEVEYRRLLEAYPKYGYNNVIVPKASVERRADFIESSL